MYATLGKIKADELVMLAICFTPVSFLAYTSVLYMEATCSCQWSVDGLHGVMSHMIELCSIFFMLLQEWNILLPDNRIHSCTPNLCIINILSRVVW